MNETQLIECPGCNGDGGWNVETGIDYRDGSLLGYFEECSTCHGKREIEEPIIIRTQDDLDEEDAS